MTCDTCTQPAGTNRANLVDGTVVCTWCPKWMHECEARHVLSLQPLAARQEYLHGTPKFEYGKWRDVGGILQRRGPEAVDRLKATMLALWNKRKAEENAQRLARESKPANTGTDQHADNERKAA